MFSNIMFFIIILIMAFTLLKKAFGSKTKSMDLWPSPQGMAVCSLAEKYFRHFYPHENYADNLIDIYKARNKLLGPQGSLAHMLSKRFPNVKPRLYSERQQCYFFGRSIADIAALSLAGELCPNNGDQFQLEKLKFCFQYILDHPDSIGLQKEYRDVPQKGLWRANEPQVITIINKET